MLRYVMPVTDRDGSILGYVVINYVADRLRARGDLATQHKRESLWLVNTNGGYLFGPDPERLWGFQIPERAERNLKKDDPVAWEARRMAENDFIMDVSRELWLESSVVLRKSILLIGAFGLFMILAISVFLARTTRANREMKDQLINDTFGHELGDLFLAGIADSLRDTIKRTDKIIRYGGDEFIVLLRNCTIGKGVELLWKALVALRKKGEAQGSRVAWSFSRGAVVFIGNQPYDKDSLIRRADELMYQHKQEWKKDNC